MAVRQYLKSGAEDRVELRRAATGEVMKSYSLPRRHSWFSVYPMSFSFSGKLLIFGGEDGEIALWNIATQPQPEILSGLLCGKVSFLAVSAADDLVASGGIGLVRLWDPRSAPLVPTMHNIPLYEIGADNLVVAGQTVLATEAQEGNGDDRIIDNDEKRSRGVLLHRYDVTTGHDATLLLPTTRLPQRQWLSPDGKWLVAELELVRGVGDIDGMELWNVAQHKSVLTLPQAAGPINNIAFAPDSSQVALLANNGRVSIYDTASGRILHRLATQIQLPRLAHMALSPDKSLLAVADAGGAIRLFDTSDGHLKSTLAATGVVNALQFSADGTLLASGNVTITVQNQVRKVDTAIHLWDPQSGELRWGIDESDHGLANLTFSPDDKTLLVSMWDANGEVAAGTVTLLDVERGLKRDEFVEPCGGGKAYYTGDGKQVVIATESGAVELWDLQTLQHAEP
jgi:WD40 repeat protein